MLSVASSGTGQQTVRALGAGGAWCARGAELVEAWQRAALGAGAAAAWLALRLQAAAAAVVAAAALLAVLQRTMHAADPGQIPCLSTSIYTSFTTHMLRYHYHLPSRLFDRTLFVLATPHSN